MDSTRASSDEHNPNPNVLTDQSNPTRACCCEDLMASMRAMIRELAVMVDEIKRSGSPHLQISASPSTPRSSPNLSELSASRSLQLHFVGTFPKSFFTLENIPPFMVELRDASGSRVEVGPAASAKIQIVSLDGDFKAADRNDWTQREFKKHFLTPRETKGPIIIGDYEIFLSKGVAFIRKLSFTDNSRWVKAGFRLGAWIMEDVSPRVIVREAISEAFTVKEGRLANQKSKTPILEDGICRLKGIGKNGPVSRRLADEANVHTVKDFLQLYHTNATRLEKILQVPPKNLAKIVQNAESCQPTSDQYLYETKDFELLLDCAFNILNLRYTAHKSIPLHYEFLDDYHKGCAHDLRLSAYEKRSEVLKINNTWTYMQYIDSKTANQGNQLLEYTYGYDHIHQMLNTSLQEETDNYYEVPTEDKAASKVMVVYIVTKAAMLFMIPIQQESTVPQKKRKLQ